LNHEGREEHEVNIFFVTIVTFVVEKKYL